MIKRLNVFADGFLVGYLTDNNAGLIFTYTPEWQTNPDANPLSLDLPLSEQSFQGDPVTAFFENLLPEGDVLDFICGIMKISPSNTIGLLERFGGDTAGAFSFLPEGMQPSHDPHYLPITTKDIQKWFKRSRGIPLSLAGEQSRMSLSGAQDKMTIFIDQKYGMYLPLGAAPSSHIIKPSVTHRLNVPHTAINEAMIMRLAKQIGFIVADLSYDPKLDAAIIRRYDREFNADGHLQRLHQNDLCQILGVLSGKKYEQEGGPSLKACFNAVVSRSSQPALDKKRLLEWVIFNFLVGNRDGHAKNLSVMVTSGSTKLSPFYDMVCTAVYPNLETRFAFKIGGENRVHWVMPRHWDRFAAEIGIKPEFVKKSQIDIVNRIESALPGVVKELNTEGLSLENRKMIQKISDLITASIAQMRMRMKGDANSGKTSVPMDVNDQEDQDDDKRVSPF